MKLANVLASPSPSGRLWMGTLKTSLKRMYLSWSLCTLYLLACLVRVTVFDSGLLLLCLWYVFQMLFNSHVCAVCFYFTIAHLHFNIWVALYRWPSAALLLSHLPLFFFSPGNWKPSSVLPSRRPKCGWQRSPQMRTWMKRCDCSRCPHWMLPPLATWQVRKSAILIQMAL